MNTLAISIKREKHILTSLFFISLLLMATYIYLVGATVRHVVIKKEIQQTIREKNSELALLEAKYMQNQHRLSNLTPSDDFVEVDAIFIRRKPKTLVLSTHTD